MFQRILIILLLVSTFSLELWSQSTDFEESLYVGVRQGASLTRINFIEGDDYPQDLKLGYWGGATAKMITNKHLGVQLDLSFSQKGWVENLNISLTEDSISTTYQFDFQRNLNYVELGIYTYIDIGKGKTKGIINFGPHIATRISQKPTLSISSEQGDASEDVYNTLSTYHQAPLTGRVELGLDIGLGIMRQLPKGDLHLELRLMHGLNSIYSTSGDLFAFSQNQVFGLSLAYLFKLDGFKLKEPTSPLDE